MGSSRLRGLRAREATYLTVVAEAEHVIDRAGSRFHHLYWFAEPAYRDGRMLGFHNSALGKRITQVVIIR
jgi:hypothetical protein